MESKHTTFFFIYSNHSPITGMTSKFAEEKESDKDK